MEYPTFNEMTKMLIARNMSKSSISNVLYLVSADRRLVARHHPQIAVGQPQQLCQRHLWQGKWEQLFLDVKHCDFS